MPIKLSVSIVTYNNKKTINKCLESLINFLPKDMDVSFYVIDNASNDNSKNVLEAFRVAKEKGMKTILVTRNAINNCNDFADLTISLEGNSEFPGQTGGNNNNFHFEDILSKLTHMAVGLLKEKVNNEN